MFDKETLIVEITEELNNVDFDDLGSVDDSFQYMCDYLDTIDDMSLMIPLKTILNDIINYPTLQDAYFGMLDYLNEKE